MIEVKFKRFIKDEELLEIANLIGNGCLLSNKTTKYPDKIHVVVVKADKEHLNAHNGYMTQEHLEEKFKKIMLENDYKWGCVFRKLFFIDETNATLVKLLIS